MRALSAISLTMLMLFSSLLFPVTKAVDTVTTGDVTMSGSQVLDGNYTVSAGDTLVFDSGLSLDAKEFRIIVEGTLLATDAHIFSTTPSKTSGNGNVFSAGV